MARNEELQEKELEVVEPENVHGISSSSPPRVEQRSTRPQQSTLESANFQGHHSRAMPANKVPNERMWGTAYS